VLVCSNSTGTVKVEPLVIGKYANPRIKQANLAVDYKSNSKAQVSPANKIEEDDGGDRDIKICR